MIKNPTIEFDIIDIMTEDNKEKEISCLSHQTKFAKQLLYILCNSSSYPPYQI